MVVVLGLALYPVAILTHMKVYVLGCAAVGVLCMVGYTWRGRAPTATIKLAWPVYAFWAMIHASAVWSIAPRDTLTGALTVSASFVLFHVALTLFRRRGSGWFTRVVLFTPHVWACVVGGSLIRYGSVRVTSTAMGHAVGSIANIAPAVTELTVPYLLYIAITDERRRAAAVMGVGSALFVVMASQSRGALLMVCATLALVALLFGQTLVAKVRRLLVLCAVVGLAGAVLVGTLGAGFLTVPLDRLAGSQMLSAAALDEPALDEGDYLRTVMYLEGIAAIRADPWRGLGYNALGSVVEAATGARLISHNILLTAWGELGATGLVLALMIAGVGTARVWRARANTRNVDPKAFYFHTATLIAWALALAHAQVRPQLTNPMFHVVVAAAFAAGSHHVTWSRDARPSR